MAIHNDQSRDGDASAMWLNGLATQPDNSNVAELAERLPARSDSLLAASRRVDWRFLLPDPELGQVAYFGVRDESHIKSLRLFSESLVCAESGQRCGQFDTVVMSDPSARTLEEAARLVRAEGFLYVEVSGLASLVWRRQSLSGGRLDASDLLLHHPAGCTAAIGRLGFTDVQAHWHWPDFASCTKIIPLDDRAALRYGLGRGGTNYKARLRTLLGSGLLWAGLFGWTVPYFSVVARRVDQ